jgi:exosome complex component RRP46
MGPLNLNLVYFNFDIGNSQVLCSVYGPIAAKGRDELIDRAVIQIYYTPVTGTSSPRDRFYECYLKECAEALIISTMYPRTLIKITCQSLSNDECIISTAINAMILALIDSGLSLYSTATAITTMIHQDGRLLLDPTEAEMKVI